MFIFPTLTKTYRYIRKFSNIKEIMALEKFPISMKLWHPYIKVYVDTIKRGPIYYDILVTLFDKVSLYGNNFDIN